MLFLFGLFLLIQDPPPFLKTALFSATPTKIATIQILQTNPATQNVAPTLTPSYGIGSTKISPNDGAYMVYIPAGEFLMGSGVIDTQAYDDEKPQHTVSLDAFWIDQFIVTNGLYKKCVDAGKCSPPSSQRSNTRDMYYGNSQYNLYPVINVLWNNANSYCIWAGKRLPTEAEWENAARGSDGRIYPWGNTFDKNRLNSLEGRRGDTTAVDEYPSGASPYGAMDMAGNVWEWVADWYDSGYYKTSPVRNPTGPSSGSRKVVRGGAFNSGYAPYAVRASFRGVQITPGAGPTSIIFGYWDNAIGFRCAQ